MPSTQTPAPLSAHRESLIHDAAEVTSKVYGRAAELLQFVERVTGAGVWWLDLPENRVNCSDQLAALLELPSGRELTLEDTLDFYTPEFRGPMAAAFAACMDTGVAFDQEACVITQSGKRLWIRTSAKARRDDSGKLVRLDGVLQDLTEKKRAEQESLSVTMRLGTTLASITEAFVTLDCEGRLIYVNSESERLLRRKSGELLGKILWLELDEVGSGRLRRELNSALLSGVCAEFEEFYPTLEKWLELRVYPFEEGLAVYFRDVSARRQSQEQLLLLQTSISRLNDFVLITEAGTPESPARRIVFANDAFERLTGYSQSEVLGQQPRLLQGPLTQHAELRRIHTALQQAKPVRAELINYKKDGELFWIELEIVPVDYFSRGLTHWVAVGRDITARKAAEDEIEHLAFFDALTQLPNRQLLTDRLTRALSPATDNAQIGALMFIDLDHFKVINDTQGHSKGDALLQQVASRLSTSVRLSDTVARLGGDEFVVMLEHLGNDPDLAADKANMVSEKILAALSQPYDLGGYQYHGTCSIGITFFSKQQETISDLLKQADLAMYQAKAAGRNGFCFFDPGMQAAATANAALNSELRQALRLHEFVLHYQPQVGPQGMMMGVEALIRWQHPERGLVMPGDFISQAEESGLIVPLGNWVLETACAQLSSWAERPETKHLSIAVNVSVRQFRDPEFVELIMTLLKQRNIGPKLLSLEITESLLVTDMDVAIAKMGMLKEAGVTLSIDDFGMGYSALSYLKYLPLDQLKIDRTFITDLLTDPNDAAIARTIVGLAQSLGLSVLAEGVETEDQRELLARYGCHCYQGHLFCKALPIAELEAFMQTMPA